MTAHYDVLLVVRLTSTLTYILVRGTARRQKHHFIARSCCHKYTICDNLQVCAGLQCADGHWVELEQAIWQQTLEVSTSLALKWSKNLDNTVIENKLVFHCWHYYQYYYKIHYPTAAGQYTVALYPVQRPLFTCSIV